VTAECLGRLGVIDFSTVIPKLEEIAKSTNAPVRAVAVTALRFSLQGSFVGEGIGFEIGQRIDSFLSMLNDKDLDVQREAVLTARSFCISKQISINRSHLTNTILPALYSQTVAHPELIHEMDYGNFKVIVDDGLPLRKAVYQTLEAVLTTSSNRIEMRTFTDNMKVGLSDADPDVQIMTYQIYQRLARSHPDVLLEILDDFPGLILAPVKSHLKVAKSKEPLRAFEVLRVIVSVMLTFNTLKGVELCPKYNKFFQQVCRTVALQNILKELQGKS
jgi:cullin-associated NEDD8-dissociated protein 1